MEKKNQDKPITKEELGLMLHKYINPLYEKVDNLEGKFYNLEKKMDNLDRDVDEIKRIQLRMENRLIDDNKLLHDCDDAHDKKLKNHEKRISILEEQS